MESKAIASVLEIVEKSGSLKLEDILEHRVTDECLSIFNVNGTTRKVQKSKLQEKLTMTPIPEPNIYTSIIDMGLIWRLAAPTNEDREKGDGTKYTWRDFAEKVVQSVLTISNVFMKLEDKFPAIKDFHALLGNPSNKIRLQAFLETAFQATASTTNIEIIYSVVGGSAKNLTTGKTVPEFECYHAEADTAIFTIYIALRSDGYMEAVIIDTEDTDNYVQAAYVAQQISGLLCLKRKRELITARCLCSEEMAASIIPLHVLTGCDHNSGFYGASKKLIADRLQGSKQAHDLLAACGKQLPATKAVIDDLELFVIRYIYCDAKNRTLGELRAAKWRSQKKKSTVRLVPDSDSLRHHLERASYLAYLQKHFHLQSHPSPIGHGWHLVDGLCVPIRSTNPALPLCISLPTYQQVEVDKKNDSGSESDSESYSSCSESSSDSDD